MRRSPVPVLAYGLGLELTGSQLTSPPHSAEGRIRRIGRVSTLLDALPTMSAPFARPPAATGRGLLWDPDRQIERKPCHLPHQKSVPDSTRITSPRPTDGWPSVGAAAPRRMAQQATVTFRATVNLRGQAGGSTSRPVSTAFSKRKRVCRSDIRLDMAGHRLSKRHCERTRTSILPDHVGGNPPCSCRHQSRLSPDADCRRLSAASNRSPGVLRAGIDRSRTVPAPGGATPLDSGRSQGRSLGGDLTAGSRLLHDADSRAVGARPFRVQGWPSRSWESSRSRRWDGGVDLRIRTPVSR